VIVVDPAVWHWRGQRWAHLASDRDLAELHAFAARLGLRRLAFQGDHYDVDEAARLRALGAGAEPVSARDLVRRLRAAGLRRNGPRAVLRWRTVGEWSLTSLPAPDGSSGPPIVVLAGTPEGELFPAGSLADLVGRGRSVPGDDVVLRLLARRGEAAAVLARRGCERPLAGFEVVVELGSGPPAGRPG
jgi:hypothetical protein